MKEVTGPIIATTAVLMAVFVPVAFIPGVAGRLYNQFALTVAISVGISAFNSLTLSPALSAAFLRHRGAAAASRRSAGSTAGFDWLSHAYAARRAPCSSACAGPCSALFVAGARRHLLLISQRIPSTFLPVEDQGYFFVVIQLPDGASLERTDAVAKQVRDILQSDARRRHRRLDQRPQLPDQRGAVELGGGVRHPEAVGRARRPSRAPRISWPACARKLLCDPRGRSR